MKNRINFIATFLLTLFFCGLAVNVNATHISKPVLVEPETHYRVGDKVIINGWVDYNAQPTADVLLHFQVTDQAETVLTEQSYPSDKQGHFHFEFDTTNQPPGTYSITITSHCLEIHRSICSLNSETLTFELNNP
ncbi:MAG: hypothetical protein KDF59_00820 [Nitrosomonas sp.]|nr:hypothetical protein [Nitrosomonas sp.]